MFIYFFGTAKVEFFSIKGMLGYLQKRNNSRCPIKSIIWSISSIQSCLHQKSRDTIQLHFTLWMELDLSSKHFPFLSFKTDHHTHDDTSFHHLFWLLLPPLLIQQIWCMFWHCPLHACDVELIILRLAWYGTVIVQCHGWYGNDFPWKK